MKTTHALALILVLAAVPAHAGPSDTKELTPVLASNPGPSGVVFTGINDRASALYTYLGTVYALNGKLDSSGWFLRAVVGGGQYSYGDPAIQGRVRGYLFDSTAGIGYKYVQPNWSVAGAVGPNFRDKMLNVVPPGDGEADRVGAEFNLDLYAMTGRVVWSGLGEFSTVDTSTWDRVRVGYQFDPMKITVGPEFSFCRDKYGGPNDFDEYRVGAFVSVNVTDRFGVSLSSGYADYSDQSGSSGSTNSVYGDLGLSYAY
jgi:hypothetical protein